MSMKVTIDLPDELFKKAQICAIQRNVTFQKLIEIGLNKIIENETKNTRHNETLKRLYKGLHLGGKALSREEVHQRDHRIQIRDPDH